MLELSDVRLRLDAVEGFNHGFPAGEITVVLGPNQSGKTNLCRLIAGLNSEATGQVRLAGRDIGELSPRGRPVSLVYQAFVNYPNLTVRENIASPLRARKISARVVVERVDELAEALQIDELLDRLPHELSGGQQQRLAIARAMAKDAAVLLLDEPLVNLDFKLREALEHELRELLKSSDTVVVYTSSDPRDAFTVGDRLLLLSDGEMIQSGTPLDVYRNPSSFAAMELLAEPRINRFDHNGTACALRPEHVGIGRAAGDIEFQMHVTACETNGDESIVHGQVRKHEWVVRCRGMQDIAAGADIGLSARSEDVVRF